MGKERNTDEQNGDGSSSCLYGLCPGGCDRLVYFGRVDASYICDCSEDKIFSEEEIIEYNERATKISSVRNSWFTSRKRD
jgi:hypothetical protein